MIFAFKGNGDGFERMRRSASAAVSVVTRETSLMDTLVIYGRELWDRLQPPTPPSPPHLFYSDKLRFDFQNARSSLLHKEASGKRVQPLERSGLEGKSRGTQGSQGPWQFYLRKKLKGFESPRTAEEREGVRTGERVGDAPQDPSP
ncbi:hypothetical protein NQZ68_019160 [Dissostichus eleginoides]|nr:hypothetical protein NQZ68_019160 [Dissostichus eleginoides]